ncbi:potassium transporter [Amylocystis lapponica]|nr:potassium transporter [Amylocystis lapponica]
MPLPSTLAVASTDGYATTRISVQVHGYALAALSFQALGIIYADLGTSPLYALGGIWTASGPPPPKEDVIGVISTIIWALTLLPLLKYVFIALDFGTNEGEGGTFALFQGLFPPEDEDFDADRTLTGDSTKFATSSTKQTAKIASRFRWPLLAWSLFGTSLTLSDGILTPAVSVTSAVAGISVVRPSVSNDVVPISIAFLVALFLVQSRGTSQLSFIFAPVMLGWMALIGTTGIVNIIQYPGILRAFDPSRAIMVFVRTKNYDLLTGVLLALTGSEAMFANLGQFNKCSIRLSFSLFVYPCLLLAYLGQGARLIVDGEAVLSNIFYRTIPGPVNGPLFWIIYVFAILATLIASQSLITATFSLVEQLVNMHVLPQLHLKYTSETIQGQVYIPVVNWILMVAVIIFVVGFKSSVALTNAFGFAVATVMFTTTVLIALQMRFVKRLPVVIAAAYFVVFGFLDGLFWGAALKKVPNGAWVPLMLGLILVIFMLFWTWARGLEDDFDGRNRVNLRHFIFSENNNEVARRVSRPAHECTEEELDQLDDAEKAPSYYILGSSHDLETAGRKIEVPRIPTCAIFHKLTVGKGVPHSFAGFVRQWPSLPRVVVFLAVRVLPTAHVDPHDRYVVTKVRSIQGFYGVAYHLGFRDDFDVQIGELVDRICALETRADPHGSSAAVDEIRRAAARYTHVVPHYHVVSMQADVGRLSAVVNWVRKLLIEDVYRPLVTMFPETENWVASGDEIIRVGIHAEI